MNGKWAIANSCLDDRMSRMGKLAEFSLVQPERFLAILAPDCLRMIVCAR